MWHAELGRSLPDVWSGGHQRGAQLHDLVDAVHVWAARYGQQAWLRQLDPPASRDREDAALRAVARLDGTPFPSTARLAGGWLRGRLPWRPRLPRLPRSGRSDPDAGGPAVPELPDSAELESAYCAEIVALTYEQMGLLPRHRPPGWYDPGRFWSGDRLELAPGYRLGGEIAVVLPADTTPRAAHPPHRPHRPLGRARAALTDGPRAALGALAARLPRRGHAR